MEGIRALTEPLLVLGKGEDDLEEPNAKKTPFFTKHRIVMLCIAGTFLSVWALALITRNPKQIALCAGGTLCIALLMLFYLYEEGVHYIKHSLPHSMLPIINSMLSETAGLGFIGVVIGFLAVKEEGSWLASVSEHLFGESEALLEEFEFIHNTFFWVAIAYFITNGCVILFVIRTVNQWEKAYRLEPLLAMLEGEAFQEEKHEDSKARDKEKAEETKKVPAALQRRASAAAFQSAKVLQNAMKKMMENKFFNRPDEWQCEYLRFRHRFVDQAKHLGVALPNNFKFRIYLQETAAEKLGELCELDPIMISIFWVPMGAVAIAVNLIFSMKHESLEANGGAILENSPRIMLLLPFLFPLWSVFNYRANLKIKKAIMPQPFEDGDTSAEYHSPTYIQGDPVPSDRPDHGPPANKHKHEKLFTIFGIQVGHQVYLELQKLNLFCMVLTTIFSFKTFYANLELCMEGGEGEGGEHAEHHGRMLHGAEVHGGEEGEQGVPPGAFPELLYTFAAIVLNILGLCITPSTFIQFNYATATEGFIDMECLSKVLRDQNKERLASTLASLLLFSERLSKVAVPMSLRVTVMHETLMHDRITKPGSVPDTGPGSGAPGSNSPKLSSGSRTSEQVDVDWASLLEYANPDSLIDLRHFVSSQANSNVITKNDVKLMASELGYVLEGDRLDDFFAYMDVDGGGDVDFKEFATALLLSPRAAGDETASIKERLASGTSLAVKAQLYELFDADHGGTIDEEEFVERLAAWGCDTLGVETLFNDIAGQEQTTISKKQFYRFLTMRTKEVSARHGVQKIK